MPAVAPSSAIMLQIVVRPVTSMPATPSPWNSKTRFRPPRTPLHVGDIVVSVERAIEQAEYSRGRHTGDVRWSPAEELRLLVTHGTLHVCGRDHADPAEEAAMRALERDLLGAP